MTETVTIAQHITQAQADLRTLRSRAPGEAAYHGLAQSAIAHVLTALAILLDGQERPAIPGLPRGYELDTQQAPDGRQTWRYILTGPDKREHASRYMWGSSETALANGIRAARHNQDCARPAETGTTSDNQVDVYGIANPEVD